MRYAIKMVLFVDTKICKKRDYWNSFSIFGLLEYLFCYLAKFELDSLKAELTNLVFVWLALIEPLDCAADLS